jgi:hypothetical protein
MTREEISVGQALAQYPFRPVISFQTGFSLCH